MLNTSLAPWPSFTEEEVDAVAAVVASNRVNYWTGEEGRQFEREFANWCGTAKAIALANGTLALDLALHGFGVGPGDEVIVTPRTFIASISSVVNADATPVFADVDPDSGNISPATIEAALTEKTRAIVPVHLGGWPCDMGPIMQMARERGIVVIEDCAQAHGAMWQGQRVGAIGHAGAWSFCQDKIMTTAGEGGMITTDDEDAWSRMWSFKDHGKSWDAIYNREHPPGFRWVHESFGTNWRLPEVQSAVGRIQLRRMEAWTAKRTANAMRYAEVANRFPDALRVPMPDAGDTHAYYRFYIYVRPDGLKADWSRNRILDEMNGAGIPMMQGSCSEVYCEKAFDGTGWRPAQSLPNARMLGETSLMFLTHPTLTDADVDRICGTFEGVMARAAA